MDNGYSTVRNLLYIVLVLVLLSALSSFYVGTQLARNSEELASLRQVLAKQVMGSALTQAEELEKRMDALNQSAGGIQAKMQQAQDQMDAKLKQAQDEMVARLNRELPKMLDRYIDNSIRTRGPMLEKQLEQRGLPAR